MVKQESREVVAFCSSANNPFLPNVTKIEIPGSIDFPSTKCEICDLSLRNDLEVTRHIMSATHKRNTENFKSKYSEETRFRVRTKPKDLDDVYNMLNIRSMQDIIRLRDKIFFEILTDDIASKADVIVNTLIGKLIAFLTRDIS